MTTLRPSAWLILLLPFPGMLVRAGSSPGGDRQVAADPAARELGHAFAALTQPAAVHVVPSAPPCAQRKRWQKSELLALSAKLPPPQRLTLLQHFSDDRYLSSAGILLSGTTLCDCAIVIPPTDVGVTNSPSPTTVLAGQPLTYTIVVRNYGPSAASAVSLSDTLAATLSFTDSTPGSPTCTLGGSTFTCSLGDMVAGASQTVTLNVTVSPLAGGSLANKAVVSSSTPESYSPNNSQTATVTVTPLQPGRVPDTLLLGKNAIAPDQIDLSWTASCGNSVTGYGVYEGTLGTFYSHAPFNGLCAVGALSAAGQTPGAGSTYYLIVPQSSTTEGSYGVDSNSLEIPPSGAPCQATQAFGGVCP